MKKYLCLIAVICCSAIYGFGQNVLTVTGTVYDSATGLGIYNQLVQVYVMDSNSSTVLMAGTTMTDTAGAYNLTLLLANMPNYTCSGEIDVYDCNNALQTYHFVVPPGGVVNTGWDFYICRAAANCQAGFIGANTNGGLTTFFTDYSTASGGLVNSWSWQFGDGDTSHLPTVSHTYANLGTYYVCLSITTTSGCTSTFCDSVVVGGGPGGCSGSLTYGYLGNGALGFAAPVTGTGTLLGIMYDFGDGNTLQTFDTLVPYTYPNGGTYTACVTATFSDSCIFYMCIPVTVNVTYCQSDFYAIPDTSGQFSLLLVNNALGNGLSYLWDFGDGGTSTLAYPQHTFAGGGTYYICLDVVDSTQTCADSFCDSIVVVNKLNTPFTINVVSPNAPTAAPDPQAVELGILVAPNPASDFVDVHYTLAKSAATSLHLIDLQGRELRAIPLGIPTVGAHAQRLDLQALPAGLYFLQLRSADSRSNQRLVVE